jgi:molybdate transport system substrate-binding protein
MKYNESLVDAWRLAMIRFAALGSLLAMVLVAPPVASEGRAESVLIFAAASLQTALDELTPAIARATSIDVRASYAASPSLARQIDNGAPADIFISADQDWMNYVADRRLIRPSSRFNLLGNALVLVAPAASTLTLQIAPRFALATALGDSRLAIADPDVVPAGKYAKASLTALGVWDTVASRLAPVSDVRAALLLVSRREAPLGIVYRTDALADTGVKILGTFPSSTHPRIVYPAALTVSAKPDAARVIEFLRGAVARAVFAKQGFAVDVN